MRPSTSPISVFQSVVDAIDREDWQAVASACDPVSLARFKRNILERLEPSEPLRPFTVEDYMRGQPEMPWDVAEYQVARHNQAMDPAGLLLEEMPTVASVQEIRDSSDAAVFAAWLEGKSRPQQIRRLIRSGQISPEMASSVDDRHFPRMRLIPIGAVPDGERLTHVLYRTEFSSQVDSIDDDSRPWMSNIPREEMVLLRELSGRGFLQVATCRIQSDGEWRMIADDGFLGLGNFAVGFSLGDDPEPMSGDDGS